MDFPADMARFRPMFWPKKLTPNWPISTIFDTKIAKNTEILKIGRVAEPGQSVIQIEKIQNREKLV